MDFEAHDEKAKEAIFQQIFTILKLNPNRRRKKQLLELKEYFKNLDFFKKLETPDEYDDISAQLSRFRYLKAFNLSQDQKVFDYGDKGDCFYIVIKGSVGIKVPTTCNKEFTQKQFVAFLEKNKDDLIFDKIKHHLPVKNLKEGIPKKLILDDTEVKNYEICILKEVAELKEGMSFGELALIENQPRSATVYCKSKDVYFAILNRKDFEKTYSNTQKVLTKHKMDLLRHFGIFFHFKFKTLKKLSFYLFERKYCMNQRIYTEGEFPDGVYLIENGEFELSKSIYDNNIVNKFRVSRLGQNQMFGLQECITLTTRTMNATCISTSGTVYFIPSKDFVHKFLPKTPDEVIEKELILIQEFLQLRYQSLVTLEQASDIIKMDEIISRYHCRRFVKHKKKMVEYIEKVQQDDDPSLKYKRKGLEREVYNQSVKQKRVPYFSEGEKIKPVESRERISSRVDTSIVSSSSRLEKNDKKSIRNKMRKKLTIKMDDRLSPKNTLTNQITLLKKSLKKSHDLKVTKPKIRVIKKLRRSQKMNLKSKPLKEKYKIANKRNFFITLPKKKHSAIKIGGMSIKKICNTIESPNAEKSIQTSEFKFKKIKVLNKDTKDGMSSTKASGRVSKYSRFIPTTNVFKSMDGKNRYGKTFYKVNSLDQYQKHIPERFSRRVVRQKHLELSHNSSHNSSLKKVAEDNSEYFANIKIPISLRKEFGMKHTQSTEISLSSTLPPKRASPSVDIKPKFNVKMERFPKAIDEFMAENNLDLA
ncbi:unnamed protein product [Moneuplotes crassus]|uniref:Cyclic nucleotide-binding domain-containing protein n=1 Tax=Euplotes crassus TaxID=5936 RepID=A0AAD1Y0M2_EUPCR|nr:unnamed protein product [Moneuplotes crassus]